MLQTILAFFKAFPVDRASLAAENVALRHQLGVLQRSLKPLGRADEVFGRDTRRTTTPTETMAIAKTTQTTATTSSIFSLLMVANGLDDTPRLAVAVHPFVALFPIGLAL